MKMPNRLSSRGIPPESLPAGGTSSLAAGDIALDNGVLRLVVSPAGGAIWSLWGRNATTLVPLLRAPPAGADRPVAKAACFPLVPFGNRVRGNAFRFEGRDYRLAANTAGDPHYLHGDGWLSEWSVIEAQGASVLLRLDHAGPKSPYRYRAEQRIALDGSTVRLSLEVANRGSEALPFGIGWHPYFPMDADMTLTAPATAYWTEGPGWLPDTLRAVSGELDFSGPRPVPQHWVNNGFEGWNGRARIAWPARGDVIEIDADPLFERYFLFVSSSDFDPGYRQDWFAFEPMSHGADAHNLPDLGGLTRLSPGEALKGSIRLNWRGTGA